eukprot:scaffold14363_cov111-Isochrysis_galbana.AAC.2
MPHTGMMPEPGCVWQQLGSRFPKRFIVILQFPNSKRVTSCAAVTLIDDRGSRDTRRRNALRGIISCDRAQTGNESA